MQREVGAPAHFRGIIVFRSYQIRLYMDKPKKGIAVDGYCLGNPSEKWGYRAVDVVSGSELFRKDFLEEGMSTNNIAEYCAIVHALAAGYKMSDIYTDSQTAFYWIKNGVGNSSVSNRIYERANKFMGCHGGCLVNKWDTKAWGEIIADFGNKCNNKI